MMARTVVWFKDSRRAISGADIPSWCRRNAALRLSVAIMQLPQGMEKRPRTAQDPRRQKMRLGMKGSALELRIQAFAHHPLHVFLQGLQIPQEHPLRLAAVLR